MIRVVLPPHLRTLARLDAAEMRLALSGPASLNTVLDALEARYPVLAGTLRDRATRRRRPLIRFYACREDISNLPPDTPLPEAVSRGEEPLLVIGAIAGG